MKEKRQFDSSAPLAIHFLFSLFLMGAIAIYANTSRADEVLVGVVDMQKTIQNSADGKKLQEKMMKYQALLEKSNVEIQKKQQEMSEPILHKIREKVAEIAKKKSLSLVLEKNENIVIYSEDKNEITAEVMSAIN